jgi:regulator of sigma E protease
MLATLISIAGILFTIFFVVGSHEAAHFYMARMVGVKVLTFSIGFGKRLFSYTDKRGTEYIFALIPLGGYVRMLDSTEDNVNPADLNQAYDKKSFWKKSLILLAGPSANLICAFFLYWLVFIIGFVAIKPIIGEITPHSLAADAGLTRGQQIVAVDNTPTRTWTSVLLRIMVHAGNQDHTTLTTQDFKSKKISEHTINLKAWNLDGLNPDPFASLGFAPYMPRKITNDVLQTVKFGPIAAIPEAARQLSDFVHFNLIFFQKLVTGKISLQSLGGPISIFDSAGQALNIGFLPFISFLAFLSIAIGVINFLPIPGLDGGTWMVLAIEAIIRRPLPEKLNALLYRAGFAFILIIMLQAIINDLLRLF